MHCVWMRSCGRRKPRMHGSGYGRSVRSSFSRRVGEGVRTLWRRTLFRHEIRDEGHMCYTGRDEFVLSWREKHQHCVHIVSHHGSSERMIFERAGVLESANLRAPALSEIGPPSPAPRSMDPRPASCRTRLPRAIGFVSHKSHASVYGAYGPYRLHRLHGRFVHVR